MTSSLSHVYFIKIFLRRYYPYQVQGFGILRLSLFVSRANLKLFGTPDFYAVVRRIFSDEMIISQFFEVVKIFCNFYKLQFIGEDAGETRVTFLERKVTKRTSHKKVKIASILSY